MRMMNHTRRHQVQMIQRFLCLQQRHIRSLRHSREKMMTRTTHRSRARILFHIKMSRRKSPSLRKMMLNTFNRMHRMKLNHMIRNLWTFKETTSYFLDTNRQLPISSHMILLVSDSSVSILRRMERKRRVSDYSWDFTEICKTDQTSQDWRI